VNRRGHANATPMEEGRNSPTTPACKKQRPDAQTLNSPDANAPGLHHRIVHLTITDKTKNNKKKVYWHHTSTTILEVMEQLDWGARNNDKRILSGVNGECLCEEMPLKAFCTSSGTLNLIVEEPFKVKVNYRGVNDLLRLPSGTTIGEIASMYENRESKPVRVKDKHDLFYGREVRLDEALGRSKTTTKHLELFLEFDPMGCPLGCELRFDGQPLVGRENMTFLA